MKLFNIIKNNAKLCMILSIIVLLGTIGISFALVMSDFNAIAINTNMLDINADISYDENSNGEDIVSTGNMLPISDSLVTGPDVTDSRVLKVTFNVTGYYNNPENTIYDIALHNINVDCTLRTKDLKWRLYKNNELISNPNASLSPTFDTMNNNRLVLTEVQQDLTDSIDKYTFLLWISESCTGDITECDSSMDQTKYLGKEFSASIKVELSTKSKKEVSRITGSEDSCNYKEVEIPACNTLTYNGYSQTLISIDSTDYTLTNTTGVNAGTYKITAKLNDECKWSNGDTGDKVLTCNIDKKDVTVTTLDQTVTYGNRLSNSVSNISADDLLTNDTIESVSLESDIVDVGIGKISTNNIKIVNSSNTDVTSNYNVVKKNTGLVTINCASIAVEPNVGNVMYTGEELTGVSGGSYITITGSKVGIEKGSYKVVAKPNKNYCWSDGTSNEKEYTWNIQYGEYQIVLDNKEATEKGTEVIYGVDTEGIYLDNTHTKEMTSTTNPISLPSKTGYTFAGYYTEENGSGTLVINTEGYLVSDIPSTINVLYAKWNINTYQMTIDYYHHNEGRFDRKILTLEHGTEFIPKEHVIEEEGYYADFFRYYYSYADGSWETIGQKDINDGSFIVTQKMITNIYYEKLTYEVTYDLKGGTGEIPSQTKQYGTDLTLSTTVPTKTGYTFLGWSTNSEATAKEYDAGGTYTDNSSVTLYAVWKANTYTVKFYDNLNYVNEKGTVIAVINGRTYYKANTGPALVGYSFNTSSSYTGPFLVSTNEDAVAYYYSDDSTLRVSDNSITSNGLTYYYSSGTGWKSGDLTDSSGLPNRTKYRGTRGEIAKQLAEDQTSTVSQNLTYGSNTVLTANTYTKTGFTFKGWSSSPTGEVIYTDKQSVSNLTSADGGVINLYAIWETNKYVMNNDHYYVLGNTTSTRFSKTTDNISYGTEYIPQDITPPAGYHSNNTYHYFEFYSDGSYAKVGSGQTGTDPILVIKKYTINHHYYPEKYTISYNANGGSGAPASQTKYYDTDLTLSTDIPTRENYTFLGWSTNSSATSATYSAGGSYTSNSAVTLYAVWKLNEYSVWVDHYLVKNGSNNHLQGKSETAQHGSTFTPSNYKISVETGYQAEQFGYYYRYSDGSYSFIGAKNVDGGSFTVTQEMIVNIYYKPINYSISYTLNSGSVSGNPTSYNIETESFTLNNPTRTGYTFVGWTGTGLSASSKSVTVSKGSTGNRSYTATWSPNSYTYNIVYKSSSGTKLGTATITKNYGTTNTVSPKSFTGYTSPSSQSVKWDSTTAKTITFTYTPKSYTYNIVYKSSSGTQLGTATITKNYGTTNTVSPKAFTGYTSPSSQSVTWDSTTAKTITFTYTPKSYKITENHYYLKWQNSTWTLHQTKSYTKDYGTKFSPSNVTPPTGYYATNKYAYYLTSDTNQNVLGEGTVGTNSFTVTDNLSVNVYYEPLVYEVVQTFHYYDSSQGWVQYGSDTVDHVYYGQTFTPYAYYTISGKTPLQFDWWTDGTLTGTRVDLGSTITVKGKVVVHVLYW